MKKGYRIFGTTADVGVISHGSALEGAFEAQAKGMFSVMTDLRGVRPAQVFIISAEGADEAGLLASWLEELLFLYDTQGVLLREFQITALKGYKLTSEARGEAYDPVRHIVKTPIKAVTYHMLEVTEIKGGVRTRVVYDI